MVYKKAIASTLLLLSCSSLFAQDISKPFASGSSGDLNWKLRVNLPECQHEGQKKDAWCLAGDQKAATKKNGVAGELEGWINDPKIKSVHLAYFSFSNKIIRKALCKASVDRGLKVNIYLDQSNSDDLMWWFEDNCSSTKNISVKGIGAEFSSVGGHLQHAKIFLASESEKLTSYADLSKSQKEQAKKRELYFSSSSANMSSNGLALHFENWLFFNQKENKNLAQQNICVFKSFDQALASGKADARESFAVAYKACTAKIEDSYRKDIQFYMVPTKSKYYTPIKALTSVVKSAKETLRVAIHRLTTSRVYKSLLGNAAKKVKVSVIMDDDTLRVGVENGGPAHDVGDADINAMRYLSKTKNVEVSFMETNAVTIPSLGGVPHLFHNKFVVADAKQVFQGAGNFTSRALNIYGYGNYEQFYKITIPEIAKAYDKAWKTLRSRSTLRTNHPVGNNSDI